MEYAYGSNGCTYVTNSGGQVRMQFPVLLPDGSIIQSMDVFYYDTSASNLTVWLSTYNPGTSSSDILSAASTGNSGNGMVSTAEISHIVDNDLRAYSLNYSWASVTDSTLQICGIRINYTDPFYSSFLPSAFKD